jgi:MerR family redox-sensitive transcriptional activator SoxR
VSASALRYYEELGLLPAPARVSGQRRYPESAVTVVAAIRLHSDAGFTLAEQKALITAPHDAPDWRELAQRKLAELDERIARAQAARDAISHGLRCPRRDAGQRPDFQAVCPDFQARVTTRRPRPAGLGGEGRGRCQPLPFWMTGCGFGLLGLLGLGYYEQAAFRHVFHGVPDALAAQA